MKHVTCDVCKQDMSGKDLRENHWSSFSINGDPENRIRLIIQKDGVDICLPCALKVIGIQDVVHEINFL